MVLVCFIILKGHNIRVMRSSECFFQIQPVNLLLSYQFIYLTFQKLEYKKFLIGIILWMAPGVGPFCRVSPSAWMSLFLAWRRRKKTFGNDCRGRLCEPIKEELTLLFRLCIFRNKMSTWFPASCVLIGSYLTLEKEEENDDVSNKLRGCVLMKFQLKISWSFHRHATWCRSIICALFKNRHKQFGNAMGTDENWVVAYFNEQKVMGGKEEENIPAH